MYIFFGLNKCFDKNILVVFFGMFFYPKMGGICNAALNFGKHTEPENR
jgi:hypothetical protein